MEVFAGNFTQQEPIPEEGIEAALPDKLEFYQSVDGYPNVGRICIDGVALLQTTREYGDALSRVPEWDEWCQS